MRTVSLEMSWDSEDTTTIGIEAIQLLNVDLYETTSIMDILRAKGVKVIRIRPAGASGEAYHVRGMFSGASLSMSGPAAVSRSTTPFPGAS